MLDLNTQTHVCCSLGTIPGFRPQPQAGGTCNTYKVNDGNGCWVLAESQYLKEQEIEVFLSNT